MSTEATLSHGVDVVQFTAPSALTSGQVVQLVDGRAGVVQGAGAGFASGALAAAAVQGVCTVAKTANICFLDGQKVYWVVSTNKANFKGDFYIGIAHGDAAGAAATLKVDINAKPANLISLDQGEWVEAATNGLGVTGLGGHTRKLAFDAEAEAALVALYSVDTIPVADKPIVEILAAIFDIGDNGALDINIGLANESHATDADAIAESVFFHLDGTALDPLKIESDDGTTEVVADDTTKQCTDDQYHLFQIDCRDLADIQAYFDGIEVTALAEVTCKLDAATGPLFPIVHLEKTSDDTTAEVRVKEMFARRGVVKT